MNKPPKHTVALALGITTAAAGLSLLSPRARADSGINVQNFTPASGSSYVFTENGAPEIPSDASSGQSYRRFSLGLNYNYLDSPLVQTDPSGNSRTATIINGIQTLDVMAGLEWSGRFSINVAIPLDTVDVPGAASEFTAGDMRLFPKLYLMDRNSPIQLAVIPEIWFPTGNSALFTSMGGGYGLLLAAEHDFGFMSLAANVGYRGFPNAVFQDIDFRQMMPVALGLNIPFTRFLAMNAEASSSVAIPFDSNKASASDLYGGLNLRITEGAVLTGGGGVDTFNTAQSGNYRLQVGLRFAPASVDSSPVSVAPPVVKAPEPVVAAAAPPTAPVLMGPPKPLLRVVYTPKWIYVRDEILFENNSAKILAPGKSLLDEVASVLKENRKDYKSIVIEGHGNELGSDAVNLALSQKRAKAVKTYLVSKGIEGKTLKATGFGKRRPKISKDSGVSRETRLVLDRRVQFRVIH